jgi:hypothetical protein
VYRRHCHLFQIKKIYLHIHLYFKSCALVPDNGPLGPEHVEFIDNIIKRLLCLKVIYIYIYICQ